MNAATTIIINTTIMIINIIDKIERNTTNKWVVLIVINVLINYSILIVVYYCFYNVYKIVIIINIIVVYW